MNGRIRWIAVTASAGIFFGSLAAQAGELERGDVAWAERADGAQDARPDRFQVLESVNAYGNAVLAWPDDLEARWKLLRSLHFSGDFAAEDARERSRMFERARNAAEVGIDQLAETVGGGERLDEMEPDEFRLRLEASDTSPTDVARLYFWSAINWGAWSRDVGTLAAVRTGVANRIHRYASVSLELDPTYEDGGALRLLGTLHAGLPRLPFVTGWVDRDRSIPLLERAYAMDPTHPGNSFLLAATLLDLDPARRDEAIELLQQVEELPPRDDMRIEDVVIRRQARERLESVRREGAT